MTVSNDSNKHIYTANGVITEWPYTFKIIDDSDIKIYLKDLDGVITEVTANYYIDTENSQVVYPTEESELDPVPEDYTVILLRENDLVQETDLVNGGAFNAEVLEGGLDRLTLIAQQLQEQINRCIKYPVDRTISEAELADLLSEAMDALAQAAASIATTQAQVIAAAASANAAAASATVAQDAVDSLTGAPQRLTQVEIDALTEMTEGDTVFNLTMHKTQQWDGIRWQTIPYA